jgi:hypothetical protein
MEELIDNLVVAAKESATLLEKERCFHLAINTISNTLVPWPENIDSQLWNQRMDSLINKLIDVFEMEAK